jgi:hypothetical protein
VIFIDIRQDRISADINREWAIIIEVNSVEGNLIPEFIILKATFRDEKWISILHDRRTVIALSENGWTNNYLELE